MNNNSNNNTEKNPKELHIAPMLDVSYREFRYFIRLLTKQAVLWTEMVVDTTLEYAAEDSVDYHLAYNRHHEPPVICQLGGNRIDLAARATRRILHEYGYQEINLNAECPSHKVAQQRAFGAALMLQVDDLMVPLLQQMQQEAGDKSRVSIKLRIGIDDHDDWEFLYQTIRKMSTVCRRFILHARKVYTQGLDPAQNRRVPPLDYTRVYALCEAFPDCDFWINGGIRTLQQAYAICHATNDEATATTTGLSSIIPPGHGELPCDKCKAPFGSCIVPPLRTPTNLRGCLLGRAAMDHPAQFAVTDTYFYKEPSNPCPSRRVLLARYATHLETLYPRRCCDHDDTNITYRYPAPVVTFVRTACSICQDDPQQCNDHPPLEPIKTSQQLSAVNDKPTAATSTTPKPTKKTKHACKITKHIIHRALKPTMGVFFGIPGASKAWRRIITELTNRVDLRNCGPAYILRRAMRDMPDHLLDRSLEEEMAP